MMHGPINIRLTTCCGILREKLPVAQLVSNLPRAWDRKIYNLIFKSHSFTFSEPDESIPYPAVLFLSTVSPICAKVPKWSFFLQVFTPKPCKHMLCILLHACHRLPTLSPGSSYISFSFSQSFVRENNTVYFNIKSSIEWYVYYMFRFGRNIYLLSPNTDFCCGTGMNERPLLCSHIPLFEETAKVFTGNIIHGIKIYYNPQAGSCIAQTVIRVFNIRTG